MLKDVSISAVALDVVLKATVLLLVSWAVSLLLRKYSAATRYLVRVFAAAALLALPFSVVLVPAWHVKGIPDFGLNTISLRETARPAAPLARSSSGDSAPATPSATTRQAGHGKPQAIYELPSTPHVTLEQQTQSNSASRAPTPQTAATGVDSVSSPRESHRFTEAGQSYAGEFFFLAWIAGMFFLLVRWKRNSSRLSRLVRRAAVLTDSGWNAEVRALASELGIDRHIALLVSSELEIPIATGVFFPSVVISPDYAEWSSARRSAILHHELAHIKRWDALTQTLAQIVSILYWFHPMVWLMVRAMRAERERACDDHVLSAGTKASDYAHELLDIVSELRGPELAAALAMARRSQLEGRVLAILDPVLRRGPVSRKSALAVAALTLIIMLPLAALHSAPQAATNANDSSVLSTPPATLRPSTTAPPAALLDAQASTIAPSATLSDQPQSGPAAKPFLARTTTEPPEPPSPSPRADELRELVTGADQLGVCGTRTKLHNMQIQSDNGSKRWVATWSGDDCSVDLRAEGDVKFNADATEIQSISSGGYFEVNLRQNDTLKQVKVTPSGSGLEYVYKINGQQQPFAGEVKTWFAQFLLALERSTGIAADTRVPALLAKGGPNAVLDEITNLQGDYVRGLYFRKLLEQPNLPGAAVQRIIREAGEQVSSDYELARVLMTVSKQYDLADEASRTEFLNAASKLKSDYEHSRVLIELLRRPNISTVIVNLALKSSASISSDYEKSRILLSLMDQKTFEQSQLDFYLKMVESINSDYEKSRDLLAPMQRYALRPEQVNRIMDAASTMQSDYEKSRLLIALAGKGKFDEGQMSNYLKVVDSMQSDYERSRSLMTLMENNPLSAASVSKALQAVSRGQSDYEKSRVIASLVQANKFDENQMSTYLAVVDSMQSDNERSRSLLSLMEHDKLSDASLAKVISAVSRMSSDYEKSRVLLAVVGHYALTGAVRESYIKTAESINSEYERNRALAAVVKRATL